MKSTKTNGQVSNITSKEFGENEETPFSVDLALHLHKKTRNKKLIDFLADLGLTIPYDEVIKIGNDIVNQVLTKAQDNNGTYLPRNIKAGQPIHLH